MSQRFVYSVPARTLPIPATADRICVSEPSPHTYGVRHLSCGTIATEPCRPTVCNPPGLPTPTANYSLLTANSSFNFGNDTHTLYAYDSVSNINNIAHNAATAQPNFDAKDKWQLNEMVRQIRKK